VTIRERDTQAQIRIKIGDISRVIKDLVSGDLTWDELVAESSNNKKATSDDKKKPAKAEEEEDDIDLGFDDEEEEDSSNKAPSRAEQAAALKKQRDAELEEKKQAAMERLAKKEANQRSLCNLEIKPWEAEQDLMELFAKIKTTVVKDGLKWSENCALVDVAYGIKKIVLTAVISLNLSMDAIIEEMTEEIFPDEIQSMSMTSMSLL
jgi:elongation factor 1-beta